MNHARIHTLAMLALLVLVPYPLFAQAPPLPDGEDWPVFLGPRGDDISIESGLLKQWTEKGPPIVWHREVGQSYSAPVTAKGRIVYFHRLEDQELIECADMLTGKAIWSFGYPTQYEDRYGYNNGPRSSPAIDGDRVYTYGAEGVLTCVNFQTGAKVWQRPINAEYKVPQGFFGAGVAPVIEGDLVLLNIGATDGASIVAVNKSTGETVWKSGNDEASYSTPLVRTINNERLGIFFTREGLRVHEVKSGAERFHLKFRSKVHESVNAATPVVKNDLVFLSATYNTGAVLLKLVPGANPGEPQIIWHDRDAMQNHWMTSVLWEDNLYGMDGRHEAGSNFRCIEFMTGKVRWASDQGLGRSAFIVAEGHIIALGERGDLALVELNPDRYIEKARVRLLRYPCWTPPIISRGHLYIRDENILACLDLREKR